MGSLMLRCPTTNRDFYRINTDDNGFRLMMIAARSPCYGQSHSWLPWRVWLAEKHTAHADCGDKMRPKTNNWST